MIRLTVPSIGEEDLAAVSEILASGYLVQGPRVREFEEQIAHIAGVRHAIAVSNGTAALHLAMLALDVRPGDLVAVTSYSWIATANVIELCGGQPVFIDIDPGTFNMAPEALFLTLNRLAENKETIRRVKAVLPIHAFGQPADMPAILRIAGDYQLPVIEDAACALAARLHGRPAGSWATLGTFSFHPRKAITTGEGGMVTTDNDAYARSIRALRNHGLDPETSSPDFVVPGFNYRLTEFQAALGLSQIKKLERIVNSRRCLAEKYKALLADSPITAPAVLAGSEPAYQSYVCLLPAAQAPRRPAIIKALRERGIETTIGTWHMPLTSYFRTRYGYRPGDFPVTDDVFARSIALPLYEGLTLENQQHVVRSLFEEIG
ncbi:MAG TPA: DegT/DnrJ/EryC1/StrS family aminotransferase [Terriglobales bacterium]